jgi:hypothetical protein
MVVKMSANPDFTLFILKATKCRTLITTNSTNPVAA